MIVIVDVVDYGNKLYIDKANLIVVNRNWMNQNFLWMRRRRRMSLTMNLSMPMLMVWMMTMMELMIQYNNWRLASCMGNIDENNRNRKLIPAVMDRLIEGKNRINLNLTQKRATGRRFLFLGKINLHIYLHRDNRRQMPLVILLLDPNSHDALVYMLMVRRIIFLQQNRTFRFKFKLNSKHY